MVKEEDIEPLSNHPRYRPISALSFGRRVLMRCDAHLCAVTPLLSRSFGFVRLYRDQERDGGALCAIKFLERGEKITKYIEAEVLNHRILRHPHVIEFREVFLTDDYICIAMEYAAGGSLFQYVQKAGRLQEAAARWFFQQLIIGLDYCHRKGVVNRDIKLENTLLQNIPGLPLPLLKVCDFGYSKAQFMSAPKSKVGTLAYMAPEVIRSTGNYDGKLADIWSCGVMLFVMLFGQYPFDMAAKPQQQEQRAQTMMARIVQAQWVVPDGVPISPAGHDLLKRLMTADPLKRLKMAEIQQHPWFQFNLPAEALLMNDQCLSHPDVTGVQSEEMVKGILLKAQSVTHGKSSEANPAGGNEDDNAYENEIIDAEIEEGLGLGDSGMIS